MTRNYFTLKTYALFACIFFAGIFALSAQVKKDFEVRFQDNIKGDITFIGNNIVNRESGSTSPNSPYNDTGNSSDYNDDLNMQYIDIDGDSSTFSSSSARLSIADLNCSKVVYAGLYWTAKYPFEEGKGSRSGGYYVVDSKRYDFKEVRLKTPGNPYLDLTADEVIYDGIVDDPDGDVPYTCYKDITDVISGLTDPNGEYTVANIRAAKGYIKGGGSAGWSMVVVYENPTLPGKFITTFDGFAGIDSEDPPVEIDVEGFITLPEPYPVHANMIVSTLEGDNKIDGDGLSISAENNPFFKLGTSYPNSINRKNNFFDSNITLNNQIVTQRNPNSTNTLGFDTDKFKVPNPDNSVIPNNATQAKLQLNTEGDTYYVYFTSFDVEIIEPDIKLVKGVYDKTKKDIQGEVIELGEEIQYTLTFDNIGNDHGTNFTIRDELPMNVDLIDVIMPQAEAGEQPITYTYDYDTNEIVFTIPDEYVIVERGGDNTVTIKDDYTIRINVKVQEDCDKLRDACSNIVKNLAYATYQGVLNDNQITNDPSILGLDSCLAEIDGSSNFLPDLSKCGSFDRTLELCGETAVLTAGAGYDRYQWYKDNGSGTFELLSGETNPTYTATNIGTYKVTKETDAEDCKDFEEIIHVVYRGNTETNPFTAVADEVVVCSNDGTQLPKFFLCGTNDDRPLNVSFPDAIGFSWQKLDDSCTHTALEDCPTKDNSCTWNVEKEGEGADNYTLSGPGEYRLEVRYQNGCFNRFYFKAYENSVSPVVTHKDMACGKPGSIDISGVGDGYEYAIGLGEQDYQPNELVWQDESNFSIDTPGIYGVYIRQSDVVTGEGDREPCLFRGEDVVIDDLTFGFSAIPSAPLCYNGKGSIAVSVNGALPHYSFWLKNEDGTTIEEELASEDNFYEFSNQSPGTYIIEVSTVDGCNDKKTVVIPNGEDIDFTATAHDIACDDGSVTLNVIDGTGSYSYAVWSYTPTNGATASPISYNDYSEVPASAYFTDETFVVSEGAQGIYVFMVTDENGCKKLSNEVTVNFNPPVEWELSETNLSCFLSNDGVITVDHGATNGYTLTYQLIDLSGNPINSEDGEFNNLPAGRNYKVIVTQTYGDQNCSSEEVTVLTEPDRLTASAGVSKLPGCNDTDIELAEVRITNPLGGTFPYEYSFDNGHTYGSSAIGELKADTHTLYIRDIKGCTFPMTVVIPELPVAPDAEVVYSYNCDGTGNITVIPSIPDYEYTYDVNGTPVTGEFEDGFTFDNLDPGTHTVTIHYNNPNYATYSNLLNEDFGRGANTTSPYIDPVYCYESQYANDPSDCDPEGEFNRQINDGEYSVTSKIDPGKELFVGWISPVDHTNPTEPGGRYMAINIGGVAGVGGVIFKKRVFDVIPHQKISVELEAFNLIGEGTNDRKDPYLTIQLVGTDGVVINEIDTEQIPRHTDAHSWINYAVELNPENNDELDIVIRTQSEEESGNDIAIDDILAYQIPEKCDLTLEVPIEIESKPFGAKIDGVTDAICSGADDGEIEISVSNYDPVQGFQYSIDDGTNWSAVITSSPFTISDLSAGDYKILVRDVRDTVNCVQELEESIEDPSPLNLSAEVTTPMSCSNNYTAVITVSADGGSGVFEYRLEGENGLIIDFQPENIFTVVGLENIGDYTISVRDENNCTSPTLANVEIIAPEEVNIDLSSDTCITANNGKIYVSVTKGNGGYQFSLDNTNWHNPDPSTPFTYTFDGLVTGESYTVYVKDSMGCPTSEAITLNEPINLTADAQTSITCFGDADGSLTLNVNNFETSYTYSIDGVDEINSYTSNTLVVENLSSGSHTIVVTDENGCSVSHDFKIDSPTAALEASILSITEITCISDGSVTVSALQGWGSYTYELISADGIVSVGPQSEATFTNIVAGKYEVIVRDAGGCETPLTFKLDNPTPPEVTLTPETNLCNSDAGVVLVATASGGKSPYQYQLNGGAPQSSNEFTVYQAGNYTVTVIDANDCTDTNDTAIIINEELQVSATLTKDLDCSASNDAVITLEISGGYPNYTMDVLKDGAVIETGVTVANGDIYNAGDSGKYSFAISDSEGCTDTTNIVEVTNNEPPTVTTVAVDPLCAGSSNGTIELEITGGLPPYTIDLNGSATSKIGGLPAGTYHYTVTDSKGCETPGSVNLIDPLELKPGTVDLVEDYRCDNTSAIIELIDYEGGTTNATTSYEFSLDNVNFQASPKFDTNILPRDYAIYIRDANGCVASADITIDPLNKPTKLNFSATVMTCPDLNSDVTITVEGGNAPFTYEIIAPSGSIVNNAGNNVFESLTVGTYTFKVTDAKGCTIEDTYTIKEIPQIDASLNTVVDRVCTGESTGSMTVIISDFITSYSYTLVDASNSILYSESNQNETTLELINLSEGSYTLTVTDETTNCFDEIKETINAPAAAIGMSLDFTPITCVANGSISVTAQDGWGDYSYQLEKSIGEIVTAYQISNKFNNVVAGDYVVRVKDELGCTVTEAILFEDAVPPTISVETDAGFCYSSTTNATLEVSISNGHAPFKYKINGGELTDVTLVDDKFTIVNLTPGDYTIVVYDSYGCEANAITETIQKELTASSVISKTLDCTLNSPDAIIDVEVSGGYMPYQGYQVSFNGGNWSDPLEPIAGTTFSYNASEPGTYIFQITDAKGCIVTTEKVIEPISSPVINKIVATDASCYDSATGALDVQIDQTTGVSPYTIEVFQENADGTRGASLGNQTTNLPAGNYIVEVTDAKECKIEGKAIINEPQLLDVTVVEEPLQCIQDQGIKLGSILVSINSGGTGNFTIELYDRNDALVVPDPDNNPSTGVGLNSNVLFAGLNYGEYTIRIVDANGCETFREAVIETYADILIENEGLAACELGSGQMKVTANNLDPEAPIGDGSFYFAIYPYTAPFDINNPTANGWFPGDTDDNRSYTFTDLDPGVTYTFVVYDEITKCEFIQEGTVPVAFESEMAPIIDVAHNVTCKGEGDGYAEFSVSGFASNATSVGYQVYNAYDYTAVTGASGILSIDGETVSGSTPKNLPPGEYYIMFTEIDGVHEQCVKPSETFRIRESLEQLQLTATATNDNCTSNAGRITATATFGTAPYTYQFLLSTETAPIASDPGWTDASTFNGESGEYIVYVKDANNCIVSENKTIVLDPAAEITLATTNQCDAASGSFGIEVKLSKEGIAPYFISVDGSPFIAATALSNLGDVFSIGALTAGTHTIAIKDANGCEFPAQIEILEPISLTAVITTEAFCDPIDHGAIDINVAGGSGNFTYAIISSNGNISGDTSGAYTGLLAGEYEFEVTDVDTGCKKSVKATLTTPELPVFKLEKKDVSCFNGNDGTITVVMDPSNLDGPYTYSLNNATPVPTPEFSGLIEGEYTITVISAKGCVASLTEEITQPVRLAMKAEASAYTCDLNYSLITATVDDVLIGTLPYTYSFDGGTYQNENFAHFPYGSGEISVSVKDANGCIAEDKVVVPEIQKLEASIESTLTIDCLNGQELINIVIEDGSGQYTVTQLPSNIPVTQLTDISLTEPGTYTYKVVDDITNCFETITYTVEPYDIMKVTATLAGNETCSYSSDGKLSVEITGYTGDFVYAIYDQNGDLIHPPSNVGNATTDPFTFETPEVLDRGIYYVEITQKDYPQCHATSNKVTIQGPDPIEVELISNVNANCNISEASVTVLASKGTPPYTYVALANGSPVPTSVDFVDDNVFNLDPTTPKWEIYVMDANGCIISSPLEVDVEKETTPEISLSIVDECVQENKFEVQVNLHLTSTGKAPYQITVDGGTPRSVSAFPVTLSGLSSGVHKVAIIDVNGCRDTKEIRILSPLGLTVTVGKQPSCTEGGVINFTPGGGSFNYFAQLYNSDGTPAGIAATGNQFLNVPHGNYIVRITDTDNDGATDSDTGCLIEVPISLEEATPVVFTWSKVDVSCHDGSNGSIEVLLDASNNQPPYTYELVQIDQFDGNEIGTATAQTGGNTIFTGLAGGFYRVKVTSDRGCIAVKEIEIVNPPALGISAELFGNCSSADGYAIQINLTDIGTAPYKVVVNGALQDIVFDANGAAVVDQLSVGKYTVEIIDANGCRSTAITTVDIVPMNFNRSLTTLLDCEPGDDGKGVITLSEISGSGNYHYTITDPTGTQFDGDFSGAEFEWTEATIPGVYTISLTDNAAAGGCEVVKIIEVPKALVPEFKLTGFDAKCYGVDNGSIYVSAIDNGTGPFIFEIIEVDEVSVTPIGADNPTPGYEATFSNLLGSDSGYLYVVRVTSTTNACSSTDKVRLSQATPLIGFTASVTPFGCSTFNNGNNAVVTVTPPTGGSGSYRYEFVYDNGTPGDTSDDYTQKSTRTEFIVSNVAGGSVTATVFDSNGCAGSSDTVSIEPYVELQELLTTVTQPTCNGYDGSVLVETVLVNTILGVDNDKLQYEIISVDGTYTDTETLDSSDANPLEHLFEDLVVGGYTITVTNLSTLCKVSTTVILNDPNTFNVEVTKIQDVICFGTETGIVDVNLIDATYTGTYQWTIYNAHDNSEVKTGNDTNNTGITLYAGAYYASITQSDTPFCVNDSYFTINQPEQPIVIDAKVSKSISCTELGEITVTASGGYGFYEFTLIDKLSGSIIQDWSSQNKFTSLSEGTYDVYVRDDKGCAEVFQTLTLEQPVQITADAIQGDVIYCDGEMTASIEVIKVAGGRPAIDTSLGYLFVLNRLDANGNIISSTSAQTNPVFTGLQAGSYSVKVFDNFGCDVLTNAVIIGEPNQVVAALSLLKSNTCETGAILELTAKGGTGTGYEYSESAAGPWTSFGSGNTVEIDVPGEITSEQTYTYYVRDSNLCISVVSNSVKLSPIRPLEATPTVVSDVSCFGNATGYIKVEVKGGLGNYRYTLIDAIRNVTLIDKQTENTFSGLISGVYLVQVDSEDCETEVRVVIEQGVELTAKTPVIYNPVCTDDLGSIEVDLVGGTGEYQYAISPNLDQFQSKNVFEDLPPGTYTIIAQDSKGCNPFVFKEEIIAPQPLEAKANVLNEEYCIGDGTGSFELTIQGGTPPYSTAINTQDDNAFEQDRRVFDGLKGGETYVVFVRDANGCQQHVQVSLKEPVDLNPKAEVRVTCISNSAANEVEIILTQEGLEDVIYTLDGGADQFDNKFANVAPGDHKVTLSYFGCEREVEFTVEAVKPLGFTVNESNLNEFTMYPTGGSAPYEYFVDGISQGSEASYVIRVSGIYEVMIVDANGCQQIAQIDMEFIDIKIPNVFTPDGDGNNDYWPPSNYGDFYPNIITKIYDRYGRVVAELRQGDTWDGRYNGTELPTGDYWYIIKLNGVNDDREFVGHFTLYR